MFPSFMSRFSTQQCSKPIFIFTLITLTISLTFSLLILGGATSSGLRKFYLISLAYSPDSGTESTILNGIDTLSSLFSDSDSSSNVTLSLIRIGYRGICLENSTTGWECASSGDALKQILGDVSGDPLDLISIADLYKEKVSWNFPWWATVAFLCISWIATAINCIPFIPVPAIARKVMAMAAAGGCVCLLGAMVLQAVTTGAVSSLVDKVSFGIIDAHVGTANAAFGWSAFGLSLLATIASTALVAAEWSFEKAQEKLQPKLDGEAIRMDNLKDPIALGNTILNKFQKQKIGSAV